MGVHPEERISPTLHLGKVSVNGIVQFILIQYKLYYTKEVYVYTCLSRAAQYIEVGRA